MLRHIALSVGRGRTARAARLDPHHARDERGDGESEQHARYVLTGGTISDSGGTWHCSTGAAGIEKIPPVDSPSVSLQERWIQEIQDQDTNAADKDAATALEAIRVSLSAEQSMQEKRRIVLV